MSELSAEERQRIRGQAEEHAPESGVEGDHDEMFLALLDALEAAEAVLREVMEDHPWRAELWYFTDETEAVLAALEAPR